jgi:hypothetical protein
MPSVAGATITSRDCLGDLREIGARACYTSKMNNTYTYPLDECDVEDKRSLEQFRAKRRLWLSWLETDDHHAIWDTIHAMVWTDIAFRSLTAFATNDESTALQNRLIAEALVNGHFATQILAMRRLVDGGNNDIISLRRLLKDIKQHSRLLTRENYVCHDGLPYDYEAVQRDEMQKHLSAGGGGLWAANAGPRAWAVSQLIHQQFDSLSGISPERRQRNDVLPASIFKTIEAWLNEGGASELEQWSHRYLAHAGGPEARKQIADIRVTNDQISATIKNLARVTEALSAHVLGAGGRSHALMPVAQFNPFEGLENPVMALSRHDAARQLWDRLSDERNAYLENVREELIGRAPTSGSPAAS